MRHRVADTSREAYHSTAGMQATQQMAVLEDIRRHPGTTRREVAQRLGFEASSVSPRVNLLVATDAVVEREKRKCSVTGRKAWTLFEAPAQKDWITP